MMYVPKICFGDYVLDISLGAKFCADLTRNFFSTYERNITPKLFVFGSSSRLYSRGPQTDLHANTSKNAVPCKDVPFWGPENKINI